MKTKRVLTFMFQGGPTRIRLPPGIQLPPGTIVMRNDKGQLVFVLGQQANLQQSNMPGSPAYRLHTMKVGSETM
jgi:hypothetical protein